MPNPDDRRAELLTKLAAHVLAHGLSGASLRPLAAAAGTSDRMLLYYFKDKDELITATLAHVMVSLAARLEELMPPRRLPASELGETLFSLAAGEALWPHMRLWLEIAALAARGDVVCRSVGEAIARGLLAWLTERLECAPDAAATQAMRLLIRLEGRLVLHGVGIDAVED